MVGWLDKPRLAQYVWDILGFIEMSSLNAQIIYLALPLAEYSARLIIDMSTLSIEPKERRRPLWRSLTPAMKAVSVASTLCFVCVVVYILYFPQQAIVVAESVNNSPVLMSATQQHSSEEQRKILDAHTQTVLTTRASLEANPPDGKHLPYRSLMSVVLDWNPDVPEIPNGFKEVLQHFDYGNPSERRMAELYRNAEIPFKLFNISEFEKTSILWDDEYLLKNFIPGKARFHVERSLSNHFMFWTGRRSISNYVPPTEMLTTISYKEWLQKAKEADAQKLGNSSEHLYFIAGADPHDNGRSFISRDLPLFSTQENNFFITKVNRNKGIQCRFGMRGVIAEAHYDSGRNMVAMLHGAKRYIITPPWTCDRLGIIADTRHPSYRHSVIDWSDPVQAEHAGFAHVDAIDTVVHNGEVLYIPSFWFHYIVSLEFSIQCNSRSGFPDSMIGQSDINKCMKVDERKKRKQLRGQN